MSRIDLHKLEDINLGILKNHFILHHFTWSDNTSLINEFFSTCFVT